MVTNRKQSVGGFIGDDPYKCCELYVTTVHAVSIVAHL